MKPSALFFILVPLIGVPYLVYLYAHHPWDTLRIAGLVIMLPGLLLLSIARFQLGNSFSITPQAHQLVTQGLYSRIRNPIYVSGMVAVLGLILFLERPYYLLIFPAIIPLQFARSRAESRVLETRFGDQYREYKSHTWF
ncbi:MAG: methyltransferase family protein [Candidatus Acidiferrum sp.]